MLTPLVFDPTCVDLYQTDPKNPRSIRSHIEAGDAKTGKHRERDFRAFLTAEEVDAIRQSRAPGADEVYEDAVVLLRRALMKIEPYNEAEAGKVIELIVKKEMALEIIGNVLAEKSDLFSVLVESAAKLYDLIDIELYVQSMRLNLEDFNSVFPSRSCVHDPQLVLRRLENPDYEVTTAERRKHFRDNRAMSFGILGCMSMYDVRENTVDPEMRMLLNAGRYQTQKAVYDDAAAVSEEPAVALGDELNGAIV